MLKKATSTMAKIRTAAGRIRFPGASTGALLKRFWWIPAALIVLLGAGLAYALSIREDLFRQRLAALLASQQEKGLNIHIEKSGFAGLRTVFFEGISVVPENRDTLLKLDECFVQVKILPLLFGNVELHELSLRDGLLHLVRRDSLTNLDFFLHRSPETEPPPGADTSATETDPATAETDLGALVHRLARGSLRRIPRNLEVRNFLFRIDDDSLKAEVLAEHVHMVRGKLESTFVLNRGVATWHLSGRVAPSAERLELRVSAEDGQFELPYLYDKYQLKLSFTDITTSMESLRYEDGVLEIHGTWGINDLLLNHPKIAANDIFLESASLDATMRFGKNWISLDSSSTASMKDIRFHPYLKYTLRPQKIYELGVHSEEMDAQAFFNSFPEGLFETLQGMKVSGRLSYHLDFRLNDSIPDSLTFHSSLEQHDFEILEFGAVDFRKINGPFVHTPFNDGEALTSFRVGPSNPDFVPLNEISDYLKHAINTAEDGNFYQHRGFNEEAFRKSIALNYKTRDFERGGSTISMQLVKNVFLDRQKTVARKLEELLIVWLIEHERLVSKERMYEVYLNVIEWGPDIYGVGPASRFYFSKHPSQLSLAESIYLASIVPSPARFSWHWNGDGTIRSSRHWYYELIRDIMLRRGWINQDEARNYFYGLRLNGPARSWVVNNSIEGAGQTDSLDRLLQDMDWLLEGVPGIFGNPAKQAAPGDTLSTGEGPDAQLEGGEDTLSRREQRRLERQRRREVRKND